MTDHYCYVRSEEFCWIPASLVAQDDKAATALVSYIPGHCYDKEEDVNSNSSNNVSNNSRKATTTTQKVNLHDYPNKSLPMQNVDETGRLITVSNLVDLMYLHEAAILYNLKDRHLNSKSYTRTGNIVVALNPYQWIPRLYSPEKRNLYSQELIWAPRVQVQGQVLEQEGGSSTVNNSVSLEPHVYEISALAYKGLAIEGTNQAILVSGESGAGKTETVKICMDHLASIQSGPSSRGMALANDTTRVVQRILNSNPLLEAFGNAKTRRNDNSSRFGKFTQLQFHNGNNNNNNIDNNIENDNGQRRQDPASTTVNIPECHLVGSTCQVYLLEKSRVVHHDSNERTFHIFYQLLAASDSNKKKIWKRLKGADGSLFKYVGGATAAEEEQQQTEIKTKMEGKSEDAVRFQQTIEALELVGVKGKKLHYLLQAICAVMQMGNIAFQDKHQKGTSESSESELQLESDACSISNPIELQALTDITGIPVPDLENGLTHRTVTIQTEKTRVPLRADVAKEFLDALAKEVYNSLFLWLVRIINEATCATKQGTLPSGNNGSNHNKNNYSNNDTPPKKNILEAESLGTIGLLDIFGFEYFDTNSLEQLCINFANEMLQSKFTKDVFQSVFEEYAYQGLSIGRIHYDDNTNVLDLLQMPRTGLFSVLNEECILPRGNDEAFCRKLVNNAKTSGSQVLFLKPAFHSYNFGIRHYATDVIYDCRGFLTKNQDTLPADLVECVVTKSTNPIIVLELSNDKNKNKPEMSSGRSRSSTLVAPTVWAKYRNQLISLMSNLEESQSRYIRCIKPNEHKLALKLENFSTLEQLRSSGVISAVTMSRAAFPNRLEHKQVIDRFDPIWRLFWCKRSNLVPAPKSTASHDMDKLREDAESLLSDALKPLEIEAANGKLQTAYAVGKTRTYFVAGALEYIEALRFKGLERCTTIAQKVGRGMLVRKTMNLTWLRARIRSRRSIQMWWRCVRAQAVYFGILRRGMIASSSLKLQCWCRSMLACKALSYLEGEAQKEQRRRDREIMALRWQKSAATRIQAVARGKRQRSRFVEQQGIHRKYNELDDEVIQLERQLCDLEQIYANGAKEHILQLEDMEEESRREADAFAHDHLGDSMANLNASFSSLGASFLNLGSPDTKQRKSVFGNDEVQQQRKVNKKIRKQLYRKEQEQKALDQNVKTLERSNDAAGNAVVDAKNVHLKLIVRTNRLQSEADNQWVVMQDTAYHLKTRLTQYEVEKRARSLYLKTLKKSVKLVKKRIPDTRLATEIDRVSALYIATERHRSGKVSGVNRQDSSSSLTSITSATEDSDSESE